MTGAGADDQEIPERDVAMSAYCEGMDIAISEGDHTGYHGEAMGKWILPHNAQNILKRGAYTYRLLIEHITVFCSRAYG